MDSGKLALSKNHLFESAEVIRNEFPAHDRERGNFCQLRGFWSQRTRWTIFLCLVGAAVYCVYRIDQIESRRFLGLTLDDDLTVLDIHYPEAFERTGFFHLGDRIVSINGVDASGEERLEPLLGRERHSPIHILVADEMNTRKLIFWDAPEIPLLTTDDGGRVSYPQNLSDPSNQLFFENRVLAVEGEAFASGGLEHSLSSHSHWIQFTLEGEESEQPVSVLIWLSDYLSPWLLWLVGICFGGLGLTVHSMSSNTRSSRAFLLFTFGCALFYLLRSIPADFRTGLENQIFGLLLCAMIVATAHFAWTFTSLRSIYVRSRIYLASWIAVGIALIVAWSLLDIYSFFFLWSGAGLIILVSVVLGLFIQKIRGISIPTPDLQRNWIVATALLLGLGPSLGHLFLQVMIEKGIITFLNGSQLPSRLWFDLPAVLFPLTIGFAVVRRNLLQVNELLLEGVTYGTLALGLAGVFAASVGFVVPLIESIRPGSSVATTGVSVGLVAWLGILMITKARRWIDERFRRSLSFYDVLASGLSDLGGDSADRRDFCERFAPSLQRLTRASFVAILLPDQNPPLPILSGDQPETAQGVDLDECWDRISSSRASDGTEISREDLLETVSSDSETWELLDALDKLSLLFVFPLISEGSAQGIVAISGRVDARNFSRAELQKLRLVARECALALYGFTIRENLRAKLNAEEELRRSQEKLRESQKLEALSTLAGGIAHDFHNLITAIFAFTAAAKETLPYDHAAAPAIENIEEAARQASGITKSLLVFTQRGGSRKSPLDLAQFLSRSIRFVEVMLPADIHIKLEVEESSPLWIKADETQLHQIVMNLVLNARDAITSEGEIRFKVYRHSKREENGGSGTSVEQITVECRDSGCGMSGEVRRRAFEPFYSTKEREQGAGLGLSIVRGIVIDHGGSIEIDSAPEKGTRVELRFPSCLPPLWGSAEELPLTSVRQAGSRIVIADDNSMIRLGLATSLRSEGYVVEQVADGRAFCDSILVNDGPVDLAVLDLDMPVMGGIRCLEFLRDRKVEIPVLMITGKPGAKLELAGYPDLTLLEKPFGMPGFLAAVNEKLSSGGPVLENGEGE